MSDSVSTIIHLSEIIATRRKEKEVFEDMVHNQKKIIESFEEDCARPEKGEIK